MKALKNVALHVPPGVIQWFIPFTSRAEPAYQQWRLAWPHMVNRLQEEQTPLPKSRCVWAAKLTLNPPGLAWEGGVRVPLQCLTWQYITKWQITWEGNMMVLGKDSWRTSWEWGRGKWGEGRKDGCKRHTRSDRKWTLSLSFLLGRAEGHRENINIPRPRLLAGTGTLPYIWAEWETVSRVGGCMFYIKPLTWRQARSSDPWWAACRSLKKYFKNNSVLLELRSCF